ncbi:Universal stress A-like protein [Nymphaea thermarum]|nr:Universal stress A-like protein [Nymphaea thermarum]
MAGGSVRERQIVVAVDESEQSAYALSWCLKNLVCDSDSGNSRDTLILLFARPPRVAYNALDGSEYLFSTDVVDHMEKYSQDLAKSVVEKATAVCKDLKNVQIQTKIESGDPRYVICEAVEKVGGDILVMGSHGYGLLSRALLGSVSNYCAQNAIISVFPSFISGFPMAAGAGGKERKIMVAVDESEESRYALSWCLENLVCDAESRKSKTVLVLLYVRPPPPAYTALDGKGIFSAEMAAILERHGNEVASSVMDRAKALCKNLPHVKVEGLVECGDARDVICEMVDRVGASILVVGSHGYGTIKSVSDHCAHKAKCPVLIVKRPKQEG